MQKRADQPLERKARVESGKEVALDVRALLSDDHVRERFDMQ